MSASTTANEPIKAAAYDVEPVPAHYGATVEDTSNKDEEAPVPVNRRAAFLAYVKTREFWIVLALG